MINQIRRITDKTFVRFILVGVLNTTVGTFIMFGFYNILSFNYWVSSAANYFFGSILSYFLNKKFTFRNKDKGYKPLIRFTVNIFVCYIVAYGVAKPLVKILLKDSSIIIRDNISMLVGMVLFVLLNYLGQRFFAFKVRIE